jgi:hypothetical protein
MHLVAAGQKDRRWPVWVGIAIWLGGWITSRCHRACGLSLEELEGRSRRCSELRCRSGSGRLLGTGGLTGERRVWADRQAGGRMAGTNSLLENCLGAVDGGGSKSEDAAGTRISGGRGCRGGVTRMVRAYASLVLSQGGGGVVVENSHGRGGTADLALDWWAVCRGGGGGGGGGSGKGR